MSDLQETLGAVIRRERRLRRRTMEWLADRAAISLVYLGEIERGKKYPSAAILERLVWALDLPLHVVLEQVADELRLSEEQAVVNAVAARMPSQPESAQQPSVPRTLECRLAA